MKVSSSAFIHFFIALSFCVMNLLSSASAKTINLYDDPTTAANIVDTLNSASGVILIYSPKDGTWVKIANPKNGNVGWVKSSELGNNSTTQTRVSVASGSGEDGKEVSTIMHFGNSVKITTEQAQAMVKKLKLQQQAVHQSMQHMVNDMNKLFQEEWKLFNQTSFPVVIPALYTPIEKNLNTPARQDKSAKNKAPLISNTTKEI